MKEQREAGKEQCGTVKEQGKVVKEQRKAATGQGTAATKQGTENREKESSCKLMTSVLAPLGDVERGVRLLPLVLKVLRRKLLLVH